MADDWKGNLMSFSLKRFGAAGLASVFLAVSTGAFAQAKKPVQPSPAQPAAPAQPGQTQGGQPQQAQQGPVKLDLVPTQNDWTKVCGHDPAANKDICYTTRDFSAQTGQAPVLALAVYDIKGEDTRIVRLLVPVGLMLRPGFRFSIDDNPMQEGAFEICFPNGCFAEAKVKGPTIEQLKKGSIMNVAVKNQANTQVTFAIPVAGFGRAFDGPPIDPKVLEEQQKKLQEELQKRAEDERKRLEAAKPGQASPAAPATTAPKE
jgi:invasion protein IalB